jgi:hypothetical protein
MLSLRYTGGTIESAPVINIPGVFMMIHDQEYRFRNEAILKACSYNKGHHFNLLSMSRLMHKQGWKILHKDESLICIKDGEGGAINFNMLCPQRMEQYMHANLYTQRSWIL